MKNHKLNHFSGIAHIVEHLEDLYSNQAAAKNSFNILVCARLNGPPHIGTLVNFMTGFVLAERMQRKYNKPASIVIELLDNLSDSGFHRNQWINGKEYCLMDSIKTNQNYAKNYKLFLNVLQKLDTIFGIPFKIHLYEDIIMQSPFRKSVLEVMRHKEYFSRQLQPSDNHLHIRIPCPTCGLMQKTPAESTIEQLGKNLFRIQEVCPNHGIHQAFFSDTNNTIIGLNNTIRMFCRGLTLVDEDVCNNTLSFIVNGYDWAGIWPLQILFSGLIHLNRSALPTIVYPPLILDDQGHKLSKSKIDPNTLDLWFHNVSLLNHTQLKKLHKEIDHWFDCTEDFFSNYNISYFKNIIEK